MMSGIQFRQGDVILVPLPFTDLKAAKQRPALIISNDSHNSKVEDLVISGITTNLSDEEYSVVIEQKDMSEGNIHFLSRIKVDKIFTVHKSIVRKKLGRVNNQILESVKEEIKKLVNL